LFLTPMLEDGKIKEDVSYFEAAIMFFLLLHSLRNQSVPCHVSTVEDQQSALSQRSW